MPYFDDSKKLIKELQTARLKKRVVFTNGCFDLLHVGHIKYLEEAKSLGDILVVGLNTDESVRKLKGDTRPVQCLEDRGEILAALRAVDFVVPFSEETPERLIKELEPDILVKGGDWPVDKIVGSAFVLGRGGEVRSLKFVAGRSSSTIIEKIIKTT